MSNTSLKQPIIFIGSGRSGTTIISEIIFQHPYLAWPSNYQEKYPKRHVINYIRRIFDNKAWSLVGKKKQLHSTSILNKYFFKPGECYKMWEFITSEHINFSRDFLLEEKEDLGKINFIRDYFTKMIKGQGRKRLAFKITGPPRIGYLLSIFPDAIFVLIRRKYIPTISSLLKVDFWGSRGMQNFWWKGPYSAEENEWAEKNKNSPAEITAYQLKKIRWAEDLEIKKYHPNILKVDYEDFVIQPKEHIKKILKHCNLDYDNRIDQFLIRNPIVSRNKKDEEYFDYDTLQKIEMVLKKFQ